MKKTYSILEHLKPAATKLILDSQNSTTIELIKLTLFDLLLKQVVVIKNEFRKLNPNDKYAREYLVLETGKYFKKYKPDVFETRFLKSLDEESVFFLKPYIKSIFNDIDSTYNFKKQIIQDSEIKNLFNFHSFISIFKILKINKKDEFIKNKIKEFLDNVDNTIVNLINSEPEKALDIVLYLKGNVFLLKNLEFELWNKINCTYKYRIETDNDFYDEWFLSELAFNSDSSISNLFSNDSDLFEDFTDIFNFDYDTSMDYSDFDFD